MSRNSRGEEYEHPTGFQPLKPKEYHYVDAQPKNEIDWRACCVVLANSHLQFVEFVMKACPNNMAIQDLGAELRERLADVIATGTIQGAKK